MSAPTPPLAASSEHGAARTNWISHKMAPGNEAQADIWIREPVALRDEPPLKVSIRTGGKRWWRRRGGRGGGGGKP